MMITQVLHCPYCQGTDIVRHGTTPEGKQRYRCRACLEGRGRTFLLEYSYAGQSPEVKQQIVEMAMNASTMSTLHSWVETLEFDSGIMSRKLPVNAFLGRIAPLFPLFGFIYERL
jgi:transposase-like protein